MNRVKELRKSLGMGQKEVALAAGVTQPTVSEWEHQKKDPSGERLLKLSELFNVEPGVVLGYQAMAAPAPDEDDDTWAIRERLRRDPDYRILFHAAGKATPEHLRAAAAMLKALEPKEDDYGAD